MSTVAHRILGIGLVVVAFTSVAGACGGQVPGAGLANTADSGPDSSSGGPGSSSGSTGGVPCEDCGGGCGRCPGLGQQCSWTHACDVGLRCSAADVCERACHANVDCDVTAYCSCVAGGESPPVLDAGLAGGCMAGLCAARKNLGTPCLLDGSEGAKGAAGANDCKPPSACVCRLANAGDAGNAADGGAASCTCQ